MTEIKKILIIRLSAVGDVINTLPALRLLRKHYPNAHIGWAVEERAREILAGDLDINELIVFRRTRHALSPGNIFSAVPAFIKALRHTDYDLALDFQGNLKSGLVSYLSRAKQRIGFAPPASKEYNYLFNNQTVPLPEQRINRIQKNLYLLRAIGIYETGLPKEPIINIENLIRVNSCPFVVPDRVVVLHPGTSAFGAYKRWSSDRYAQLADRLINELKCQVLLSWGPGEKELVDGIAAMAKNKPIILDYSLTLKQLAMLLSKATLFIGSDSAPLHLANILRRPLIGLYGPKDPVVYGPWPARADAIIVRKELDCSPCTKRSCDAPKCMDAIIVDDVFATANEILS
ncbi:MAG: glycosyltransferase family 9 protein [Candidatus Brocadiia bacterium]